MGSISRWDLIFPVNGRTHHGSTRVFRLLGCQCLLLNLKSYFGIVIFIWFLWFIDQVENHYAYRTVACSLNSIRTLSESLAPVKSFTRPTNFITSHASFTSPSHFIASHAKAYFWSTSYFCACLVCIWLCIVQCCQYESLSFSCPFGRLGWLCSLIVAFPEHLHVPNKNILL